MPTHKDLYPNVHGSFVHNSQRLETRRFLSTEREVNWEGQAMQIYSAIKKEQITETNRNRSNFKNNYAEQEKSDKWICTLGVRWDEIQECKLICNALKELSGCLGSDIGGQSLPWGDRNVLYLEFTGHMLLSKLTELHTENGFFSLYVNCTSIKCIV